MPVNYVFDLGKITDWIALFIGATGVYYARKGYYRLIKDGEDTKEQVKAANDTALEMKRLAQSQIDAQNASRELIKPWFKFASSDYFGQGQQFHVKLINDGRSQATEVEATSTPKDGFRFMVQKALHVPPSGDFYLDWFGEENTIGLLGSVVARIYFNDSFGHRYYQEFKYSEFKHSGQPKISAPQEVMANHTMSNEHR